jgi:hypothetical protein
MTSILQFTDRRDMILAYIYWCKKVSFTIKSTNAIT